MKAISQLWSVALLCIFVSQVSGAPAEMQSDDWRVSTILQSTINQYIKPYTGELVEKVTNSSAWNVFGKAINGVQGGINWTGGYLHAYYQDHLQAPTQNTLQWIENKTKPVIERVRERFQRNE
ncbi:hypothetical protein GDO81_013734 [Engystomops pustulosus]|uniref:Apolipoprotein C-IV n=1 Tax=Engystomops pustulosus TaxID=76066 RepID=A0AAV7B559_ENGPU|nr:hypothetical protein GDO81_013734 [Engystomops pustulosus]KAG8567662.1 hypothetical protein GDO81_013734 [Engystomops pustulosus]